MYSQKPRPFLTVLTHGIGQPFGSTISYPGFENSKWRFKEFAEYLIEWIPEFALRYSDYKGFNGATGVSLIRKAAKTVYTSPKYHNRGEFGEILLHALIREFFNSQPAISKVFYKTSANDTVKGFDAVHIVDTATDFEIWLGEVKFYKSAKVAIRHVAKEINQHINDGFLRNEFLFISGKVDTSWPNYAGVSDLISNRTSLDVIKTKICLPVAITYESDPYKTNTVDGPLFQQALTNECQKIISDFQSATSGLSLKIHLFLIPLHKKDELIGEADRLLRMLQG